VRNDRLDWSWRLASGGPLDAARALGLPEGFRTEVQQAAQGFIRSLAGVLEKGVAFFVDYGFPQKEYYHPQRRDGTLMCHYRHHAHADPFFLPGLQDITSHVDFSAIAGPRARAGWKSPATPVRRSSSSIAALPRLCRARRPRTARSSFPSPNQANRLMSPAENGGALQGDRARAGIPQAARGLRRRRQAGRAVRCNLSNQGGSGARGDSDGSCAGAMGQDPSADRPYHPLGQRVRHPHHGCERLAHLQCLTPFPVQDPERAHARGLARRRAAVALRRNVAAGAERHRLRAYGIVSGHFRRKLLPITPRAVFHDVQEALRGKLAHEDLSVYNAAQRAAYLVIIVCAVVLVFSGLAIWKPVQLREITAIFGGYESARVVHFLTMALLVLIVWCTS